MILADTTFVIDLLRNRHNVKKIQEIIKDEPIGLSLLSIGELYTGLHYTQMKLGLDSFIQKEKDLQKILTRFEIFELNEAIMILAGKTSAIQLIDGNPIAMVDLIIGATAKYYCVDSILTRNLKHFSCWNLNLIDY